ncbi:MAG: multiple sugar transport system substrate-binding protein [Thermomicrobiales bacterium]|nr:multiple sugar transport system substrate-binding protein [Thermomicrobiales bacterium]
MTSRRFSRRQMMKTGGLGAGFYAAAMAAPGPVRSYLIGQAAAQDKLPVSDPANVVVWTYRPDIVSDNLTKWAQLNGQPTPRFADIPGIYDYANVIAAKFLGGEKVDLMYCHSDQLNRWHKAGWIRDDIESLDWVQEMKPKLQPWGVENMSTFEGKMIGLPYWAGTKYLVYNDLHFEKAGITAPPQTWEEFEEQCKQLQAAGIANPYIPYWRKDFWALGWSMFVESYSDGDYIFDAEGNLTVTQGGTPFQAMLERWKRFYDSGIVPPDAFDIGDPTVRFNTGDHSFCMNDDYSHKRNNDPALSKIAGHAHNFLNPGKTHETTAISPMYVLGKNSNLDPAVHNDLARFYGYSYTDGVYQVADRWVLEEGLGTINMEVMNRPEIRSEFAKWRDVEVYDQQLALGKPRNVQRQLWYPEWEFKTIALVTEFVLGKKDIGAVLKEMQDNLDGAKKLYPTF